MRLATNSNWSKQLLTIAWLMFWSFSASAAPKTDVVIFTNGDKLTGEIKSLERGQLNLNTDATGTIGIEWDKIASIVSNQDIQVEVSSGVRYFGHLGASEKDASVVVLTDSGPQTLDTEQIVTMTPIEGRGISALDVDLTVGYDFAKAGGVKHATLGVDMDYRSRIRIESFRFSTVVTDSSTQETSRRTNLMLRHTRLWSDRWFTSGSLSFDQNDELGLDLRSTLGSGGGRYLIQSNSMLLSVAGELQFSRENLGSQEEDKDSLEVAITANWDWFMFDDPELDWSTSFQVIPSVTESGRVRSELNTTLSWELFDDLNWDFSFYGSWDNEPQSTSGSTSDYGVNTALTYEF